MKRKINKLLPMFFYSFIFSILSCMAVYAEGNEAVPDGTGEGTTVVTAPEAGTAVTDGSDIPDLTERRGICKPAKESAKSTASAATILNSAVLVPEWSSSVQLNNLINAIFTQILTPDMTTYDRVKACYDWLINNTSYGSADYSGWDSSLNALYSDMLSQAFPSNSYYENAFESFYTSDSLAFAVLQNHFGTCTGYSAAFIKMLRAIGLDCYLQRGLTHAASGGFTSHSWVVVVIGDEEYTFDPQVEDNIAKGQRIGYYRFCKTYADVPDKYIAYYDDQKIVEYVLSTNNADDYLQIIWMYIDTNDLENALYYAAVGQSATGDERLQKKVDNIVKAMAHPGQFYSEPYEGYEDDWNEDIIFYVFSY